MTRRRPPQHRATFRVDNLVPIGQKVATRGDVLRGHLLMICAAIPRYTAAAAREHRRVLVPLLLTPITPVPRARRGSPGDGLAPRPPGPHQSLAFYTSQCSAIALGVCVCAVYWCRASAKSSAGTSRTVRARHGQRVECCAAREHRRALVPLLLTPITPECHAPGEAVLEMGLRPRCPPEATRVLGFHFWRVYHTRTCW